MMDFDENNQHDSKLEAQFQQQLIEENMFNVDKHQIMNETQSFNDFKLQDENSRKTLLKLIYLVNQGILFNEQEAEQLVFRITKLFQLNYSRLREMTYRSLKMIMPQKYVLIIIQSLSKDLISENHQIKIYALKFIPFIQGEQHIKQIERFILDALLDANLLISSTAFVVCIHIINKFPNLVGKWLFEVVQKLDEPRENLDYYAFILLHEIKKTNLAQFIKIIIMLTKQTLQPLLKLQIVKFIKEILPHTGNPQKKVIYCFNKQLINYLLYQFSTQEPLTVFESSKILINIQELQNDDLLPINKFIEEHMYPQTDCILLYSSLIYMQNLVNNGMRRQLITTQQIIQIHALAFHFRITIASLGILLVIKLNQKNTVDQLKYLYELVYKPICRNQFLQGLREIVLFNPTYNQIVIELIKIINFQESSYELVFYAIQIIDAILYDQKQNPDVQLILFQITITRCIELQYYAIKILNKWYLNIKTPQMDLQKIQLWYKYLQIQNLCNMNEAQLDYMRQQFNNI